ncbi:MAG: arsenosugar biosynthesis radical SAM protein ArsS [Gammaproteobacteria bacterium]|nr:arsenosugar biosynthesis radical SAM protein ArsS [Gammaproteobacteria bacterium]
MKDTLEYLKDTDFPAIQRTVLETLQVNLGYLCNQQCLHCHVDAGPRRTELMSSESIDSVIQFIKKHKIKTLDLTGGAPEMNPHFCQLVTAVRALDVHVIDRCNLTILEEPGYEWLADFLADNKVEVVASLPCYQEENVNAQRGKNVFENSIKGLKKLNALGYGMQDQLTLNLVFNPQGASLPPPQNALEQDYKKSLRKEYAIEFNQLFTITNMPIKRFGSMLLSKGTFDGYMKLLKDSHTDENLEGLMCRTQISVDWQGNVYDCDFNQMLHLKSVFNKGKVKLSDLMDFDFKRSPIVVMQHCYGCTAGQGSSCGGAVT